MRAAPLLLLLAACGPLTQDPFDRPGTWRATGANEANLRAMVAEPRDLQQGRAAPTTRGQAATPGVDRLLAGQVPRLPDPRSANPAPTITIAPAGGGNVAR